MCRQILSITLRINFVRDPQEDDHMRPSKAFKQSVVLQLVLIMTPMMAIRCASDSAGGEQGEPVEGEAAEQGQSENGAGNNASLNNGGGDEAAAQGESMNNAVEGGSAENFGTANAGNNTSAGGSGNAALGESMNNLAAEDPVALNQTANPALTQSAPLNQSAPLTENVPLNAGLTPVTETTPVNGAPVDPAVPTEAIPPVEQAAATPAAGDSAARAAASPFQNPHMNWPGKGKVKYVTRQLTRHSSPNGPVVGEFEQGEHPLIYQNGNWAELHDGSFVKGNGLSEKGVGYNKRK
jgi:hypothetical protein